MHDPLSGNPAHLQGLCARLELGTPRTRVSQVYGGLQHRMWRLETERGRYAIKQLAADIDLADQAVLRRYNMSEAVAEAFAEREIPAVCALRRDSDYVQQIDGTGYLVYPWLDATALHIDRVSRPHALRVANLLARMHALDLPFQTLTAHEFDQHSKENISMLVQLARSYKREHADTLRRALPSFLEIVDAQAGVVEVLDKHLVVCHGDLDLKNVLWDSEARPALIDWESARRLNPTYELLLEALNWSGAWSSLDPAVFEAFIAAYRAAGGAIETEAVVAAYHCILGDWVYWLMYNVGRSLDPEDEERRATGEEQIAFALAALQRIMDHVPELLSVPNPPVTRRTGRADV